MKKIYIMPIKGGIDMDSIQYDPDKILNGFTIELLKELAKKLKRKIRSTKSETIQTILSNPGGKQEDIVKVWQEINRALRKDLEAFSDEALTLFSSEEIPQDERFKVGYMLTLSPNSEIRAMGEALYCRQVEDDKALDHELEEETVAVISTMIMEKEKEKEKENGDTQETIEAREIEGLHKRTLEKKLLKANIEGQKTKGQLERVRINMDTLKYQGVREKEETGKARHRVTELEGELVIKDQQIILLKQKLEQKITRKTKAENCSEINLASFQGRKALIFAERDNEVDIRLNALGIIPIWAMEIDWNRPRRRMSTCQLVLYKNNDEKLTKLDEIRDAARNWNIPCNELLNFGGRIVHD